MSNTIFTSQLRDSEEMLGVVRRSPLAHLWGFGFSLILIIAAFFFMYPLLHIGRLGLFFFLFALLSGIFFFSRTVVLFRMNVFIITSERVIDIDQQGLFSRVVSECLYENIQEMSVHIRGILGTTFRLGTLMIHTVGGRADLTIAGIRDPQKVQEAITRIQQKRADHTASEKLSAEEMVQLLERIRGSVDTGAFTRKHLRKDRSNES